MKKILVAVDDTKGSRSAVVTFTRCINDFKPLEVVLVHVEKIEGRSLMDEMLGEPEMATLRDAVKDTDLKRLLDRKAERIFALYRTAFAEAGCRTIRTVLRVGHPAEEILAAGAAEGAEMIVVGARSTRSTHRLMGSVSREVADHAEVPVLIVRNREAG
ncbi:MAG TPA: universal stress protein [Candidatus Methanoperedens sp.]|nr:universal stress protein [Candidatus Methanoperedens sp.]